MRRSLGFGLLGSDAMDQHPGLETAGHSGSRTEPRRTPNSSPECPGVGRICNRFWLPGASQRSGLVVSLGGVERIITNVVGLALRADA